MDYLVNTALQTGPIYSFFFWMCTKGQITFSFFFHPDLNFLCSFLLSTSPYLYLKKKKTLACATAKWNSSLSRGEGDDKWSITFKPQQIIDISLREHPLYEPFNRVTTEPRYWCPNVSPLPAVSTGSGFGCIQCPAHDTDHCPSLWHGGVGHLSRAIWPVWPMTPRWLKWRLSLLCCSSLETRWRVL